MRENGGESECGKMINMLNGSDQTQLMFAAMQNNSHCVGWNKALTYTDHHDDAEEVFQGRQLGQASRADA
jgi:hypothetical protein